MINPKQVRAIYALLGDHHLRDEKEALVSAFTGGRTTHVTDMHHREAYALIDHLKSLNPEQRANDKMRNKILSMAHEMGWRLKGTVKVDMDHVNNWCLQKSYLHKRLDAYTHQELPKLVSQFEEMYKSYLKSI
jgi:hypothetical protein